MKKIVFFTLMIVAVLLLCSCSGANVDELYSLPEPQKEYLQLQKLIADEILGGSEYSAPTSGTQRQSIQLVDVDGDGMDEALAFMKNSSQTPMILIYRYVDGQYELASTITGEGSAIGRVEYADLDGDGISEIIVSWKISADLLTMKSYTVHNWSSSILLSAPCKDFRISNFDSKGGSEVVVLNFDDEVGTVQVFFSDKAGEVTQASAHLSSSMISADRFRVSAIQGGKPAVFVEGHYTEDETNWYITDVLVFDDGKLKNITLDETTGSSVAKRTVEVYSVDINGDGALEVPFSETVFKQSKVTADYYVFDWICYDASGNSTLSASTYHCYNDGWYFVLPEEWRENLTVRRETGKTGERTVVISVVDPDSHQVTDMLTIFSLMDENRRDRAAVADRFILLSNETTIYAARYEAGGNPAISDSQKTDIISRFHLIYSEWNTGAV